MNALLCYNYTIRQLEHSCRPRQESTAGAKISKKKSPRVDQGGKGDQEGQVDLGGKGDQEVRRAVVQRLCDLRRV